MALPSKISPNPLKTSTVEIRFESTIKEDEVLSLFFPIFSKVFPKVTERKVPIQINKPLEDNKQPQISFSLENNYVFSNSDYFISVGRNIISFDNIGTYHLWKNYFPTIVENLKLLEATKKVQKIERIGLRFISLFGGKNQDEKPFNVGLELKYDQYEQSNNQFRFQLDKGNIKIIINLAQSAEVQIGENKLPRGAFIDIDVATFSNIPQTINDELFGLIDKLHTEEKSIFFHLLNKEFLKTLNPEY